MPLLWFPDQRICESLYMTDRVQWNPPQPVICDSEFHQIGDFVDAGGYWRGAEYHCAHCDAPLSQRIIDKYWNPGRKMVTAGD